MMRLTAQELALLQVLASDEHQRCDSDLRSLKETLPVNHVAVLVSRARLQNVLGLISKLQRTFPEQPQRCLGTAVLSKQTPDEAARLSHFPTPTEQA